MKIENVPFHTTDWSKVAATEHLGSAGVARWRTIETGNVRVRMVEYSAGQPARHQFSGFSAAHNDTRRRWP